MWGVLGPKSGIVIDQGHEIGGHHQNLFNLSRTGELVY